MWAFLIVIGGSISVAYGQVVTSITPTSGNGTLGTVISPPIGNIYNITGGTRAGTNLFHSFENFSVGAGDTANFLNTGSQTLTSNILGRVTGGNISHIFGTIQTTNFPGANLFLMNPAGFLFGPNAAVNVGGMVGFTSADYLKLADSVRFTAIPNTTTDALLSAAPVVAFGFLGSNPGAITVEGSRFTVPEGTGISFVGGNITVKAGVLDDGVTVQPARLSAPGGQISLSSVASPGESLFANLQSVPNTNGQSFTALGNVNLSEGALLDVSADAAGTVRIRGGQLMINDATISANTVNANGASAAVDVVLTGDLSIVDTRGIPAITARSTGSGDGGEVRLNSENLTATSSFVDLSLPNTLLDTSTTGTGKAGNVTIETDNLTVSGTTNNAFTFINSGTFGPGHGGDIAISADSINLNTTTVATGDFVAFNSLEGNSGVSGSGGNLDVSANSLHLEFANLTTTSSGAFEESQAGGDISLNVRNIEMRDSALDLSGPTRNGTLSINADTFLTDFTLVQALTAFEQGGDIIISAGVVELTNGSALVTSTIGDGKAGNIQINAMDHVNLLGDDGSNPQAIFQPSGLFSNSLGDHGGLGDSGNITITTPQLEMIGGRINTVTQTSGRGGNVTLHVSDSISVSGEFPSSALLVPSIFDIGPLAPSGIVTSTIGGVCPGPCGKAGDISITMGSLSIQNGGRIDSGTSSSGTGGNTTLSATDVISLSGTLIDGTPVGVFSRSVGTGAGSGAGGNISLTSGQSISISNGAAISASSIGPGNTGNIQITAGNQFAMRNSTVTTEATKSGGGIIKVTTNPNGTVQLTDSVISASVSDGTGGGGSVDIDPQFVILQNSQILAKAFEGPGGNITITSNLFLPDSNSIIDASSQFGQQGTILIQSPVSPASGKIVPLGQKPLLPTALLSQRCAALAGGSISSFTVAGRDTLPAEPGNWLSSPLAVGISESYDGTIREVRSMMEDGSSLLSLRKITPPGFLTHAFGVEASGCQS
jgi:filamentous hemagglutinin family protein